MRVQGLYIDGFGIFHKLRIEGLSPGMTLFLGLNEAGKSTLLGFFRAVLFGFPDGRSNVNPYPPLCGGRHGGNITLIDGSGKPTLVERFSGPRGGPVRVLEPDQTKGKKASLERPLGTANGTLFKNIYAFSLKELRHFESLGTEEVKEALYSAGAGIDPGRLSALKSGLDKSEGELFKPGGSKPKINQHLSRLMAIMKEKKELSGSIETYDGIRSLISSASEEITALEDRRRDLTLQSKDTEKWIQSWPDWIHFCLAKNNLKALPVIDQFPLEGLSRLEGLKTRLDGLKEGLWEKEQDITRLEEALAGLIISEDILGQSEAIAQLQRDQGHFEALAGECLSLEQETSAAAGKLEESLKKLGPDWNEKRVAAFDLSIAAGEEVRGFRERLREAQIEVQRKKDILEAALSKEQEIKAALRSLPEPSEKDPERLLQGRRACQALRRFDFNIQLLSSELGQLEARLEELKEEEDILRASLRPEAFKWPLWLPPVITVSAILLAAGFGVRDPQPLALAGGGLFLLSGAALWVLRSRQTKSAGERSGETARRIREIGDKRGSLEKKGEGLRLELNRVREQAEAEKTHLSFINPLALDDLDRIERELVEQTSQLERWTESSEALERAEERSRGGRAELGHTEGGKETEERRYRGWLDAHGLDPALSPEGVLDTFALIASVKEQSRHLGQLRSKTASLKAIRSQYIHLAGRTLKACKRGATPDGEIPFAIHTLIREFKAGEQAAQKRDLMQKELQTIRASVGRLQGQIDKVDEEMRGLIRAGGADKEDGFRERAVIFEKRSALKREMERARDGIERLSASSGEIERVMERLSGMQIEALEEERAGLEEDLKACHENLDRLKREQATYEEQVRQLVNDERIAALRGEEEALKEALTLMAEDWAVVRLAQRLIRMAGERYEKERQPHVIREAGHFFSTMTSGRYTSLVAPIGESRIEVISKDNQRKEIDQLSRGTAEQLYLALRFGFIREFTKRSGRLPVIMDETLVNFDPLRAKAAVRAVSELSREHQILFFTCHPETATLFREVDPTVTVLEISEGRVREWDDERGMRFGG
ncbi:MAG: AAA family ATPase [Pseudomonadota bacterium]